MNITFWIERKSHIAEATSLDAAKNRLPYTDFPDLP